MNILLNLKNVVLLGSFSLLVACQANQTGGSEEPGQDTTQRGAITLTDIANAQEFPDAKLDIANVTATPAGDSVRITMTFNVSNYDLKAQTSDETSQLCSNSGDGQHIHFIHNNKPYVALYEPKHEFTVAKNSEHYVLCFLSRSYHLSLKNKEASQLYHFSVDESGQLKKLPEPSTPMVFYSRPKGDYVGKDTENILFDYYLWNTTLGNDQQLKMDISSGGRDTSIMLTEWKPYFLKNLAMGKNTIRLSLVDTEGNQPEGDHTQVSRDFNLEQQEPMNQTR